MDYVGLLVTTLIGAWIGSFLGSYLKKKGENVATHEDIDKLVEQVAAVTKTTKEIESRISNEVWDRQRRWEVRKEALLELVKALADFFEASIGLDSALHVQQVQPTGAENVVGKALDSHSQASRELRRAEAVATLVCGQPFRKKFYALKLLMRQFAGNVSLGKSKEANAMLQTIVVETQALETVIRTELSLGD